MHFDFGNLIRVLQWYQQHLPVKLQQIVAKQRFISTNFVTDKSSANYSTGMWTLEHKLDQILQKLDALEKKVDSFNTRIFKLENKTAALERNLTAKEETIDILDEKISSRSSC